jgi:hypothetical protein
MELRDGLKLVDPKEFSDLLCGDYERYWHVRKWFDDDREFLRFVYEMSLKGIFVSWTALADLVLKYRSGAKYRAFHEAYRRGDIATARVLEGDFYRLKSLKNPKTKAGKAHLKHGRAYLKEILRAVRTADKLRQAEAKKEKPFMGPDDFKSLGYSSGSIHERQEAYHKS